ncbi:MAG: hypothetical protein LN545_02675 [Candidatus Megaira endosymbiont of Carteria cerasiformis]|jgi:methionyl-tRNA formyltransferase|nr:hypothetical protein [Candidatus Megaera polyxenophila]MCC8460890.1 hypothetical protein [Candidatus Megaera polyxenophila]
MTKYVVASSKRWFNQHQRSDEYKAFDIIHITSKEELTVDFLDRIKPRFVFFPHWNWIVQPEIFKKYECVVFHTAPLPFGRGGSPIQNLIARKIDAAPVCALRMTDVLDGGPIYDSIQVSLSGTIEEIFNRIANIIDTLIIKIIQFQPQPKPQVGEPVYFKRRTSSENEITKCSNIRDVYDKIRMLDGYDYPKAYIYYGGFKLEFSKANLCGETLTANVLIKKETVPSG